MCVYSNATELKLINSYYLFIFLDSLTHKLSLFFCLPT